MSEAELQFDADWPALKDTMKNLLLHFDAYFVLSAVTSKLEFFSDKWTNANLKLRKFDNIPAEVAALAIKLVLEISKNPLASLLELRWPAGACLPGAQTVNKQADRKHEADSEDEAQCNDTVVDSRRRSKLISRVYGPFVLFDEIPSVELPTPSDEAVAHAFDRLKFIDAGGTKKELQTRIANYSNFWVTGSSFYAPYLAVINASMTGKSRVIAELRFLGIFLITICLRPNKEAYLRPRRTEAVAQWIEDSAHTADPLKFLNECCALQNYIIRKLCDWLKNQPEGKQLDELAASWYDHLAEDVSVWQKVVSQAKDATSRRKPGVSKGSASETMTDAWQIEIGKLVTELGSELGRRLPEVKLFGPDSDVRILFVVDEARNLNSRVDLEGINRFHLFRKSLQAVPYYANDKPKIFAVLTDTISKVANIAPPSEVDPSGRLFAGMKILYPPFVGLNTVDLWWNHASAISVPSGSAETRLTVVCNVLRGLEAGVRVSEPKSESQSGPKFRDSLTMEILEHYFFNALFGRPAFAAFLMSKVSSSSPGSKLDIDPAAQVLNESLKTKLRCRSTDIASKRKLIDLDEDVLQDFDVFAGTECLEVSQGSVQATPFTQAEALGVLGAIASIEVSAASRLATELSARHMRLVSAISKLRKFVYTKEVSEPVLALSAHGILMSKPGDFWGQIIDRYVHSQMNQSTITGFLGEVASEVLLLMAWQRCLEIFQGGSLRVPFVPVFVFLEIFFGEKLKQISSETCKALDEMREHLAGGWIRVNQIALTISDLSVDMLCDYAIRASAIRCKPGQSAIDFVITVFFPKTPRVPKSIDTANETSAEILAQDLLEGPPQQVLTNYQVSDHNLSPEAKALLPFQFSSDGITQIVIQVKNKLCFLTAAEIKEWLISLDGNDMSYLDQNAYLPTVAVCLQFDSRRAAEDSSQYHQRGTLPLVARHQIIRKTATVNKIKTDLNHVRYVICIRRPKPSDINPLLARVDDAFQRLLEYQSDVFASKNIDAADLKHNTAAIEIQPKYRDGEPWISRDRELPKSNFSKLPDRVSGFLYSMSV